MLHVYILVHLQAEEEARISDTLLNSMVPPRIARQLKELRWWEAGPEQRAMTIADSFQHATVLFTGTISIIVVHHARHVPSFGC